MSKSQAEIKAIEAQIRSIRANPGQPARTSTTVDKSFTSPSEVGAAATLRRQPLDSQMSHQSLSTQTKHQSVLPSPSATPPAQRKQTAPSLPSLTTTPSPAANLRHAELAAMVERLQQQTARHVQQYRQLQAQSFQPPRYILDRSLKILEAQVQHINHLSAVQEAAILELKTMAETLEQDWDAMALDRGKDAELEKLPICEYIDIAVPRIEQDEDGVYVLSSRLIDLFKAEREAALTAQSLRHWGNREKTRVIPTKSAWRWWPFANASNQGKGSDRLSSQPNSVSGQRSRRVTSFSWRESIALFVGALVVRMGLDWLLMTFSLPWVPAIALLVTPAAIAVYRSGHQPDSSLVWTYRLLIIMIGLLLGGRLL